MKKLLIATAVAAALVAPQAFAQSNHFAGFSVGLNGHVITTSTEISGSGFAAKFGDSSQNASLQGAYGFVMGPNAVLGLGATYFLGDLKGGTVSDGVSTFEMKGKDQYSLYIEPGYVIGNSTLLYAKLAYLGVKGELSGGGSSASENLDGVGYGLGARVKLDRNMFLQLEFAQSDYNSKTIQGASVKPSATLGTVGIGYQF